MFEQALRHYAQVTDDYEVTELHARLIPEGETRGAHVMAHYRWFRDEYESLTRSWQDLGSPRGAQWFEPGVFQRVREIKRRSAALDVDRRHHRQQRRIPEPVLQLGEALAPGAAAGSS